MSRRMPMPPITLPSGLRSADALRVVGITSPLALRGLSRALRVTPRSTTSRSAARNSRVSSGEMIRESDCSDQLVVAKSEELRDGIVGLQDLAFEIGNEHRIRSVGNDDVSVQRAVGCDAC